ncbi:MAG: hypothetical protein IKI08_02120 [Selenomonadaceae bacterium]|nr:hypothetical protein [Selenomonadaceae bacterium]MBR7024790.1 hypothetical protein [Selenomonadaceae bacterium]
MIVDGVKVNFIGIDDATREEAANYVAYVRGRVSEPLKTINVKLCEDDMVDVSYTARGEKFERIRRITGYLVGTTDRWNDAKKSEEHDRVKHNIFN